MSSVRVVGRDDETKGQPPTVEQIRADAEAYAAERGTSVTHALSMRMIRAHETEKVRVEIALEDHGREQERRAKQAEGDLASLRADLAAAYYMDENWSVDNIIRSWQITEDEAVEVVG